MNNLPAPQRFGIAVLVIGGYLIFGAATVFFPRPDNSMIIVNTVLATMGPLVGWVVKALFEPQTPSGEQDDPLHTIDETNSER